ncbi:MAG: HEAT repeat domain-containing protein [Prolixibacteraceae bacterium]
MGKEKLNRDVQKKLFSANSDQTISAIHSIKQEGNKLYLPVLFDLLISNPEKEVQAEILTLLGSVKKSDTVPVFIKAIKDEKYRKIRKPLLTACWQNGLDFREYLTVFVQCVIEEDWETGFEAFTVIESMENYPDQEITDETTTLINQSLESCRGKKEYLLQEILLLIR